LDTGAVGWGDFGNHRYRFSHCCVQGPVPSRLSTIVEGESLFNDGVALVLFSLILQVNRLAHSQLDGFQELFVVIAGGTLVGLALGYLSTGFICPVGRSAQ